MAWQVRDLGGEDRLEGAFWGLLFALLFLLPAGLRARCAEGTGLPGKEAAWPPELALIGVDADFAAAVRASVVRGTSALFVLREGPLDVLTPGIGHNAREIGRRVLTSDERDRLRAGFGE